jgi:hypothetical protein
MLALVVRDGKSAVCTLSSRGGSGFNFILTACGSDPTLISILLRQLSPFLRVCHNSLLLAELGFFSLGRRLSCGVRLMAANGGFGRGFT